MKRLLVITTGGTIFQRAAQDRVMTLQVTAAELLQNIQEDVGDQYGFELLDLQVRSGAELTWDTIFRARDAVLQKLQSAAGVVLITGTDTMEEFAFSLSVLLDSQLTAQRKTLAVTGAMLPADQRGYDGPGNVRDAVKVAAAERPELSRVVVVMNNNIHLGQYVFKGDSQLIGAFRSHPGPLGQIRAGRPVLYYSPPPLPPLDQDEAEAFSQLTPAALKQRVPIWVLSVQPFLPESLLEAGLDGLVLAGSGTGSVPQVILEQLSPKWTSRMPIVIVSRCQTGGSPDDFYYRGSLDKYLSGGFVVGGDYEHLNAVQARTLLMLRLSALGHP